MSGTEKQRSVPFVKASACGNDFILVETKHVTRDLAELTREICHRSLGVGADGVEWLSESAKGDVRAHLINSDGSYAEISGNGTRCVAAWFAAERGCESVRIETGAGVKTCSVTTRDGRDFHFATDMGKPDVHAPSNVQLKGGELRGVPVSMGNPHFVTFVNAFPSNWKSIAEELQSRTDAFPESTNVEFVRVIDDSKIEILIYERGAGETMSSGTGSSAAAVAAIVTGRVHGRVIVESPGGAQTVEWTDDNLFLEGPATLICKGEYFL